MKIGIFSMCIMIISFVKVALYGNKHAPCDPFDELGISLLDIQAVLHILNIFHVITFGYSAHQAIAPYLF